MTTSTPSRLFGRGSWTEAQRIASVLRKETVGGALLLIGAAIALVWANSPWAESYEALRDTTVGPASLHLDLSLGTWAADGLLAIFFFVAGLELKREFVAGDLREPRRAALPIAAAVGGMVVPALFFVVFNLNAREGALQGWAIPSATDIAFALAVLAVISTHLPSALRTFLLTLAVVDDLLAITIIAIFYTASLAVTPLLLSLIPLALFGFLVQKRIRSWWLLLPLAAVTWVLVHESGVHATVAGVLLAFTVPVIRSDAAGGPDAGPGMAEHFEHRIRPLSAGVAVPVFAFFSAGVAIGGLSGLGESLGDSIAVGIMVGLVAGKAIGITGATWLVARFTRAQLDENLGWPDVVGLALLGGMGFTVSLLITELAYGAESESYDHAKVGILFGTLLAALSAAVILRLRNRRYRAMYLQEISDIDHDGIPDAWDPVDDRPGHGAGRVTTPPPGPGASAATEELGEEAARPGYETVDDEAEHEPDWEGAPPPGRTATDAAEDLGEHDGPRPGYETVDDRAEHDPDWSGARPPGRTLGPGDRS
ncbi:Na+/H+ antiporter NhaA [Blastococcus sp. MG754426]|uniref:Na+/H+ antiporter NhaA n=2 Tax=Blastococcus TaxID=38501 RepID=UPI001EF0EBCA|nr:MULTISPECIES: Na+/H+ antiporter NhaA [unclassified Blastococcus]MCF6509834.1 Na+/H+ antiporter NhaA [Blastococcus sp. MG754426]MCF6737053.1 Na+/H+ antiporter NhaA [Blastococcus sp. KM273129]